MNEYVYTKVLHDEMQAVISNLEAREWIQGTEVDGDAVCAHGAVMTCEVLRPGDEHIIRAVLRTRGLTEDWNDEDGRTKGEVLAMMRQIEITDADLADTFGPNWRMVIAVIRRAAILTFDEAKRMVDAWNAGMNAAWNAGMDASGYAARYSARDAAWNAAMDASWYAARDASRDSAWTAAVDASWYAARDSAVAVVVADLVGQHGLTQEHIDTLMKPWIDVLGDNWELKNA